MQKTSRTPPVIAINSVRTNVVRLQRKTEATRYERRSSPNDVEELSALMERASNAARQMKYFMLASKQFSFEELASSASRAGFVQAGSNPQLQEALFQRPGDAPDWTFSVSFRDRARVAIIAESWSDIFGLVLTAYSQMATVSVEINPTIAESDLGHNALLLKDMLLTFPGFDDMPAWAKYPEGHIPEAGGLVAMWRDGVSVASIVGWTWNSILPRAVGIWELLRERWRPSR
jgi:hypothetical protein